MFGSWSEVGPQVNLNRSWLNYHNCSRGKVKVSSGFTTLSCWFKTLIELNLT